MELLGGAGSVGATAASLADAAEDAEMMACIRKGGKSSAVRKYRAMRGCDFEQASKAVDMLTATRQLAAGFGGRFFLDVVERQIGGNK